MHHCIPEPKVFWSLKDAGRQKQKIGRDRETQLDRDIHQETQKKRPRDRVS